MKPALITYSPEQIQAYQSQWKRYEAAQLIDSATIVTEGEPGINTEMVAQFQTPDKKVVSGFRQVRARLIGGGEIRASNRARIVFSPAGVTIGVVTKKGQIAFFGNPTESSVPIAQQNAVGYVCDCPDYTGLEIDLLKEVDGQFTREWSTVGVLGACKHILALRILRNEPIAIPEDVPLVEKKNEQKTQLSRGVKMASKPSKPKGIGWK